MNSEPDFTLNDHDFTPNTLRFERYKRSKTLRGNSLALAQILAHLAKKPEYEHFKAILSETAVDVRKHAQIAAKDRRSRVLEALQSHAAELGEIAEDARLPKAEARQVLDDLHAEGLIVVKYRRHTLELGDHRVPLFFLKGLE